MKRTPTLIPETGPSKPEPGSLPKPETIIHSFLMHPDGSLEDVRWCGFRKALQAREQVRESMKDL